MAEVPQALLLTMKHVSALVTLKRSAIYERVKDGRFPPPVKLSARCSRWRQADVHAWLAAQVPAQ